MNVFFKFLIFYFSFLSFLKRKVFVKNIKQSDFVLDIGSGDKPFWRADVIVDKYLEDDQQRHSGKMIYDKRKVFINADVESLPFKDKVFDFVFCTHLLEHVENPDIALSEIIRVGKSGYIEVPNGIIDLLQPFPPHLWFCDYKDDTLFFIQKEKEKDHIIEITEKFGKFFFNIPVIQYLFIKFQDKVFISIYWKKSLKYKVIRSSGKVYKYYYDRNVGQEKNISTRVEFIIYQCFYILLTTLFFRKKNFDPDIFMQ